MNPQDFPYFMAVAEEGSFSRAAKRLGISQPALSSRISRLEGAIRQPLFDRAYSPLRLTAAGTAYLSFAQRVQSEQRSLLHQLADISELASGSLTVAGSSSFTSSYLPRVLVKFLQLYPNISLDISNGRAPELAQKTLSGALDCFITPIQQQEDELDYFDFLQERIFLAVPAEWPINKQLQQLQVSSSDLLDGSSSKKSYPAVSAAVFAALPLVLLQEDLHIRTMADSFFGSHAANPANVVDQMGTSFALTQAGLGISLISDSVVRYGSVQPLPCFYAFEESISRRTMALACKKRGYRSRALLEFMRLMRETYS